MNFVHLFRQFRRLTFCWFVLHPRPIKAALSALTMATVAPLQIKVVTKQPCYWATFTAIMPFMFVMFCLFLEVWCV